MKLGASRSVLLLSSTLISYVRPFSINLALMPGKNEVRTCWNGLSANRFAHVRGVDLQPSRFRRHTLASLNAVVDFDDVDHVVLRGSDGKSNMPDNWSQSGVYACFNKNGEMQYVAMSRRVAASIEAHMQVVGPDCYSAKAVVWEKPTKSDLENTARSWIEKCVVKTGDAPPGNTPDVQIWRMKPSEARRAKQNLQFDSGSFPEDAEAQIRKIIETYRIVLFMKGTRQAPQARSI